MNGEFIYQVRVSSWESPEDVVTMLTHAVWTALQQVKPLRTVDPHRWPDLHRDFSEVFKGRLQPHKDCGTLPDCSCSIGVYGGRPDGKAPSGPTYLLALRGGLLRFVAGLAALVRRRFRENPRREMSLGRKERDLIEGALHRALTPYLYYNEGCFSCHVRAGRADRRIWNPGREAPVEGPNTTAGQGD